MADIALWTTCPTKPWNESLKAYFTNLPFKTIPPFQSTRYNAIQVTPSGVLERSIQWFWLLYNEIVLIDVVINFCTVLSFPVSSTSERSRPFTKAAAKPLERTFSCIDCGRSIIGSGVVRQESLREWRGRSWPEERVRHALPKFTLLVLQPFLSTFVSAKTKSVSYWIETLLHFYHFYTLQF